MNAVRARKDATRAAARERATDLEELVDVENFDANVDGGAEVDLDTHDAADAAATATATALPVLEAMEASDIVERRRIGFFFTIAKS